MAAVKRKLVGHYNYYGITDNIDGLARYLYEITRLLFKWLNRRSQKKSYDWTGFSKMLEIYQLPKPRIKVNIYAI